LEPGAVAAEGRHPDSPGRVITNRMPTGERELVAANFEEVATLVAAGESG
jgi:hypothetical protein